MIVLAVDTCLGACTAVLGEGGRVVASRTTPMMRGHQEALAPMVEALMADAGLRFADIGKVAATVGPGSFTGLRVGLSFARAMALALDVPAVGIGTLETFAWQQPGYVLSLIDGRKGQVHWQTFEDGIATSEPTASSLSELQQRLEGRQPSLTVGPGAGLAAGLWPGAQTEIVDAPSPQALAALAASSTAPPAPLYLRPPDAKLPGGRDPQW